MIKAESLFTKTARTGAKYQSSIRIKPYLDQGVLQLIWDIRTGLQTDIPSKVNQVYYRLSRRGQDFLIQYSYDAKQYIQMRIFHMHKKIQVANVGIYACSPLNSSHTAQFYDLSIKQSIWKAYVAPQN